MKKQKNNLRQDTVDSQNFHVGIELELRAPFDGNEESSHDDDGCWEAQSDLLRDMGAETILRDYLALSRHQASDLCNYFDLDQWVSDYMTGWDCGGGCGHEIPGDGDETREALETALRRLTGNTSFKVVSDGSISKESEQIDAEVCWNYFASRETLKDNEKILEFLSEEGCDFDKSCGLHINLNNYLRVEKFSIPTGMLETLFNFVAKSRRTSTFCNRRGVGINGDKYSMIFHQGDRLEFRFFSPTLDAEKLNSYVSLANVIYRRLAGKPAKMSKKLEKYFLTKMVEVNGLTEEQARESINFVNSLPSIIELNSILVQAQLEDMEEGA